MSHRDDLEALRTRHASLSAEAGRSAAERDEARRALDELEAHARLPVLDNIRVASPCTAGWDNMTGDARVRACATCQKNVYNLTEMTRVEAEALIIEKEGKLCIRYLQRHDGTILLKDCTIGAQKKRKRRVLIAGAAMLAASAAMAAVQLRRAQRLPVDRIEASLTSRDEPNGITLTMHEPPRAPSRDDGQYTEGQMVKMGAAEVEPPADPTPKHKHGAKK